jgi:hypothetical protein
MAILCQVRQRVEHWPYVEGCKKTATHQVNPSFRIHAEGIEYICSEHAEDMVNGFGNQAVSQLEYKLNESSTGIEPFSSSESGKDNQLADL